MKLAGSIITPYMCMGLVYERGFMSEGWMGPYKMAQSLEFCSRHRAQKRDGNLCGMLWDCHDLSDLLVIRVWPAGNRAAQGLHSSTCCRQVCPAVVLSVLPVRLRCCCPGALFTSCLGYECCCAHWYLWPHRCDQLLQVSRAQGL